MSAKYKSPSFLLPNELNTSANPLNTDGNPATGTGINSLYSMKFGSSNYINLGDDVPPFNQTTSKFSISFWLYNTAYPLEVNKCIFENRANYAGGVSYNSGISFESRTNNKLFWLLMYPSSSYNYVTFPQTELNEDEWNHIAIVFDGTESNYQDRIEIYVNNSPVTLNYPSSNVPTQIAGASAGDEFRIAKGAQPNFVGQMDEFCIFSKSLTSIEVSALHNSGTPAAAATVLNLGASAYYPLGEQAQNSGYPSATGNEWQFPNGVLQDYVMDFDGTSDYIDANTTVQSNLDFSVSAWINPASYDKAILGTRPTISAGSSNGFTININSSGNLWGRIFTQSTVTQVQTGSVISLNNWSHIAITYQSSSKTLKTYLNGSEVGSVVGSVSSVASINDLNIGRASIGSSLYSYFNGSISNTQIFNSVIPGIGTNSIETLYNNSSPLTDMSGFTSLTNWWKLNADSVYTPSAPNYTTALGFNSTKNDFDKVTVGDLTTLATPSNDITISLWAKLRTIANAQDKYGMPYSDKSGYIYFSLSGSVLKYESNLRGTTNLKDTTGIAPSELLKWHHIVVTFSGTEAKLYYNSQLLDTGTAGSATNFGEDTTIGTLRNTTNPTYSFNGFISNVAVLQSALSASQVSTLFNFGTPETNISFSPIHNWKLDNLTTGLNDTGSLASNNGTAGSVNGTGPVQESASVAVVPSWKIPSALPIPSANYTTALEFNGLAGIPSYAASYINTNYTGLSGATEFSMSFWLKCDDITADNSFFGNRNNSNQGISGQINSSTFYTYLQSGANYASFTTASVGVVSGQWFNIVFFYNGSGASNTDRLKIYINENIVTYSLVGTVPSSLDASTQPLWVGSGNRVSNGFGGEISNFALWNTNQLTNLNNIWNLGTPQLSSYTVTPTIWYKMTDTNSGIQDSSGNNNNGTNSNSTKVFSNVVAGNIPVNGVSTTLPSTALQQSDLQFDSPYSNYSLSFDGATYVDCGNDSVLTPANAISISLWIKTGTNSPLQYSGPLDKHVSGTGGYHFFFPNSSTSEIKFGLGNPKVTLTSTTQVGDTNWHHILATCDNVNGKLYIDGVLEDTASMNLSTLSNSENLKIGGDNVSTFYLNGKIDETAIFNTALTEAQVLEIYNNGKPGDLDNFSGTAPISWWRLGENAYFDNNAITVPNSIAGAPNGVGPGTVVNMLTADAPGTYANGIGDGLAVTDRVGDAALSVANSQSYNMIPDDKVPYVPGYVGLQTTNAFEMTFNGVDSFFDTGNIDLGINSTLSMWFKPSTSPAVNDYALIGEGSNGFDYVVRRVSSNAFYVWVGGGGGNTGYANFGLTIASNIIVGSWNFLAIRKAGDTITVYLKNTNGEFNSTATLSLWATSSMTFDRIGSRTTSPPSSVFSGQIDEVAGFSEALTHDQIKFDLYEATTPGKTADIENNTNLPTPVAWYRMGD